MTYIHFIVNPISGNGKHNISASFIQNYFPNNQFKTVVDYTKHKKHAIELTKAAVANTPDYIVACGGDGTINEVASCLIGTSIKLGIIPVGSGNGLASNLNIPRNFEKAIEIIRKGTVSTIDVGKINEHYFFSNTGIGIDALIIKKYEHSGQRTLIAYVKAALSSSLEFKTRNTILSYNDKKVNANPFLLFISNSNEMGYNMSLTPKASLNDGWLDLIVVPKLSFIKKMTLGYHVLRNTVEKFKKAEHALIKNLDIEIPDATQLDAQIDGESHLLNTNKINISIIKNGLTVITD
ncbi:diacylglycerol kinase family lipid kinase [Flavobacterium sp. LS1R47]|jgi:diacylglycerol kinase (ATP)|uniref:Diacylglycerol kinase family lipid kinase n=1 Tax=Flavobacterium frigoritolerans TaxID=2987686 RepID=A0A9X2Z0W3_9FLAO|nr:diacylglycerol kinase family protein [Flavobacterium frigoritolerans]MCV9933094.1 diacylglycerol kinase family lipid kinase [Flavobacterium frigoritolerans]